MCFRRVGFWFGELGNGDGSSSASVEFVNLQLQSRGRSRAGQGGRSRAGQGGRTGTEARIAGVGFEMGVGSARTLGTCTVVEQPAACVDLPFDRHTGRSHERGKGERVKKKQGEKNRSRQNSTLTTSASELDTESCRQQADDSTMFLSWSTHCISSS